MNKLVLLLFFNFISWHIFSNNLDVLEFAIKKINQNEELFSYTSETIVSDDKKDVVTISEYNPQNEPKFKLLSVNGNTPTSKDIKNFRKQQDNDSNTKMEDLLGESYTYISQDGDIIKYSYITKSDLIPKKDSKMSGEIYLNIKEKTIEKIILKNINEISIAIGVVISNFVMEFKFTEYNSDISVLDKMGLDIKGKAFVVDFNQVSNSKLYNYKLVK